MRKPIDIKPCRAPNRIDLNCKGIVPVAILSTADFDAASVDPATVEFAGASPVCWKMKDVCPGDGRDDLVLYFNKQDLNLDEDSTEASLTGYDENGEFIWGVDNVEIVPKCHSLCYHLLRNYFPFSRNHFPRYW